MKLNAKSRSEAVRIASNGVLILIKVIAGLLTGSISIIAEAIHSTIDLAAAILAFISVSVSDRPADEQHPFGHGKTENLSSVWVAILIFASAITIITQGIK